MRKLLLTTALLIAGISAQAAEGITVYPALGEPVNFLFENEPEISFLADKLVVRTAQSKTPVEFEIDNISEITLGELSGIDAEAAAELKGITATAEAGAVTFSNIPKGTAVTVYTLDGRKALTVMTTDGTCRIDRSKPGTGIYIVRIGAFSTKVAL